MHSKYCAKDSNITCKICSHFFSHDRMQNDCVNINQIWTYPKCLSAWWHQQRTHLIANQFINYMRTALETEICALSEMVGSIFLKSGSAWYLITQVCPVAFDSYEIICQKCMNLFINRTKKTTTTNANEFNSVSLLPGLLSTWSHYFAILLMHMKWKVLYQLKSLFLIQNVALLWITKNKKQKNRDVGAN